jgi:hypothetical protein
MSDRELLELAAKAAGLKVRSWSGHYATLEDGSEWIPLYDDGDALRLAGKLCFNVNMKSEGCVVDSGNDGWIEFGETLAATRRAVVRAAAEIGKSL